MSLYFDFDVTVDGSPGQYVVSARGPGEIQVSPVPFVYRETEELREQLEDIYDGYAPEREAMEAVGSLLYNALFPRSVYRAWERSQAQLPEGGKLRLRLNVRPPELSRLPWELLSDEGYFLAVRLSYSIVRHIESGIPVASSLARHPLRVLYLHASPIDMVPLDLAASEKAIRQALGADCEIKVLRKTTPDALITVLREKQGFHILHYDGHALFDEQTDEGYLVLHDADNMAFMLSGERLATFLDGTSVRLVVLAACETGMDSTKKRFAGIAQHLMHTSNLPAAVAMQFAIPDESAINFIRHFYQALAADYPIDAAVTEGRKGILASLSDSASPDWATPVLFMRAKDGHILRPMIEEEQTIEPKGEYRGKRRFEAAMPSTSKVEKITEVRVMVSLPNSQGLRAYLPDYTKSNDLIRKEDVVENEVPIEFPIDPTTGQLKPTLVFVKVTAPEFKLAKATQNLRIPPNGDSGLVTFFLTPEAHGQDKRVKVELFEDEQQKVLIGSLTLMSDVKEDWYNLIGRVWQLATLRLTMAVIKVPQPSYGGIYIGNNAQIGEVYTDGKRQINTGGGAYFEGDVNTGGGYFANQRNVGNITGSTGFIIVHHGKVTVNQGSGAVIYSTRTHDELAKQFAQIYKQITKEPEAFQDVLIDIIKSIEEESAKGPQADVKKIEGKLAILARMAPDILEVIANTLLNPINGLATAIQMVAKKAKQQ